MKGKVLVVFHYFENNQIYIENFRYFMRYGYAEWLDFVVVIAGKCTVDLPKHDNVKYVFSENKNNDYGGYADVVNSGAVNTEAYDFFVFVNSSVRGPFRPTFSSKCWTEYFTEQLVDDVGLVGTSINILPRHTMESRLYKERYGGVEPYSHVQTMAYALSKPVLAYLISRGFYNVTRKLNKVEVVCEYEIRLSRVITENGWNLKCLLPEYNQIDYRVPHGDVNPASDNGDPCFPFAYFGRTAHPFETLFVKTNRGLVSHRYLDRLAESAAVEFMLRTQKATGAEAVIGNVALEDNASDQFVTFEVESVYLRRRVRKWLPRWLRTVLNRVSSIAS